MSNNSKMLLLVRKHDGLVKAIGIFLVDIVLILMVLMPMFGKTGEVQGVIGKKEKELEALSDRVVILNSLDGETLNERVEILDKLLPPTKDVVAYLATVDGLSRELSLSLGGVSLNPGGVFEASDSGKTAGSKPTRQSKLNTLETEVKINGSEEDIYTFLLEIENTAPLLQVRDVKMSKFGGEEGFSLGLRLTMFYADPLTSDSLKGVVSLFSPKEESLFEEITGFKSYRFAGVTEFGDDFEIEGKDDLFREGAIDQESALPPEEESEELSPPIEESP